jgi:hypothetical protein
VTDDVGVVVPLEALVGAVENLAVVLEVASALSAGVRVGEVAEGSLLDGDDLEVGVVDAERVALVDVLASAVDLILPDSTVRTHSPSRARSN